MTTPTLSMSSENSLQLTVDLSWNVADMSTDGLTPWIAWPQWANYATVAWGNTGVDTPIGVRAVHVCNHGDSAIDKYDVYSPGITTHPAGAAGHVLFVDVQHYAKFIRLAYTATSGGTGDVHTDETETSGNPATITFWR